MTDRSLPLREFTRRLAAVTDEAEIRCLMKVTIGDLQKGFPAPEQIAVSPTIMGLDRTRIADGVEALVCADAQVD